MPQVAEDHTGDFGPGKYTVVHQAGVLRNATLGKVIGVLPKGTSVDIVEVQNVMGEKTIRGRLAEGGWISLHNSASGDTWVRGDGASSSKPTLPPVRKPSDGADVLKWLDAHAAKASTTASDSSDAVQLAMSNGRITGLS